MGILGIQTPTLMLICKTFYWLSHLPSPIWSWVSRLQFDYMWVYERGRDQSLLLNYSCQKTITLVNVSKKSQLSYSWAFVFLLATETWFFLPVVYSSSNYIEPPLDFNHLTLGVWALGSQFFHPYLADGLSGHGQHPEVINQQGGEHDCSALSTEVGILLLGPFQGRMRWVSIAGRQPSSASITPFSQSSMTTKSHLNNATCPSAPLG